MTEFDAKVKKWGNSLAVVLPHDKVGSNKVKRNQIVDIIAVRKSDALRKLFGRFADLKPAQKIKDELRKDGM